MCAESTACLFWRLLYPIIFVKIFRLFFNVFKHLNIELENLKKWIQCRLLDMNKDAKENWALNNCKALYVNSLALHNINNIQERKYFFVHFNH